MVFSDRGVPTTYRHMHGFAVHTFKWVNAQDKAFWVKYHWKSTAGIQCVTGDDISCLCGEDPDACTRDLFNQIAGGGEAVWNFNVQIIPYEEGLNYKYDIFVPTKVVLYSDYPEITIGRPDSVHILPKTGKTKGSTLLISTRNATKLNACSTS